MKISLLITLLFFSYYSKAQHTKDVYNTKINKVNNANINNSNVNIAKVDSVFIGQVITDRTITSEVYFLGTITKHDLNGIYTTTFRFAPKVNPGAFAINVIIEFDSSFIPWYQGDPPPPYNTLILGQKNVVDIKDDYGYTSNVTPHWTTNYKTIIVRGLVAADNLYVSVRSRIKLFATIRGVKGEVGN